MNWQRISCSIVCANSNADFGIGQCRSRRSRQCAGSSRPRCRPQRQPSLHSSASALRSASAASETSLSASPSRARAADRPLCKALIDAAMASRSSMAACSASRRRQRLRHGPLRRDPIGGLGSALFFGLPFRVSRQYRSATLPPTHARVPLGCSAAVNTMHGQDRHCVPRTGWVSRKARSACCAASISAADRPRVSPRMRRISGVVKSCRAHVVVTSPECGRRSRPTAR